MYHSLTFYHDEYDSPARNTWDHWHLVPTSRPVFNPPALKRKTLDIPGKNGTLDLTETLTGYPVFEQREGSIEFIVMNDYWEWQEAYSAISDFLHGQRMKIFPEDDPEYFYEGRMTVNQWKSDKYYSLIILDYFLDPFKRERERSEIIMDIPVQSPERPYWQIPKSFYGTAPVCPELEIHTNDEMKVRVKGLLIDPRDRMGTISAFEKENVTNGIKDIPEFVLYGETSYLLVDFESDASLEIEDTAGDDILDSNGNQLKGSPSGTVAIRCHYGRL